MLVCVLVCVWVCMLVYVSIANAMLWLAVPPKKVAKHCLK